MSSQRVTAKELRDIVRRVPTWHSPSQWLIRAGVMAAVFFAVRHITQLWVSPQVWDFTQSRLPDDPSVFVQAISGVWAMLLTSGFMCFLMIFAIPVFAPPRDAIRMAGPLHRATVRRDQAQLRLNAAAAAAKTVLACAERGEPIEDGHVPTSKDACRDRNRMVMRRTMRELASALADLERRQRQLARIEQREGRKHQRYLARLERVGLLRA